MTPARYYRCNLCTTFSVPADEIGVALMFTHLRDHEQGIPQPRGHAVPCIVHEGMTCTTHDACQAAAAQHTFERELERVEPEVTRWADGGLVTVPTLYGRKVREMRYDDRGPVWLRLNDGRTLTSDDQGRTWTAVEFPRSIADRARALEAEDRAAGRIL